MNYHHLIYVFGADINYRLFITHITSIIVSILKKIINHLPVIVTGITKWVHRMVSTRYVAHLNFNMYVWHKHSSYLNISQVKLKQKY